MKAAPTPFAKRLGLLLSSSFFLVGPAVAALNIDPKADIHPTAVLMGNVSVGAYTKIGPKAVIQGNISIGDHVNILGNAVLSSNRLTIGNYVRIDYGAKVLDGRPAVPGIGVRDSGDEAYIRNNCWVGMNATVRGARMEEGSAVGNGAVADFGTHLEKNAVLAHGAVARHDTSIPANALAEGNPAKITKKNASDGDRRRIFGLVPAEWIHNENDQIAAGIDRRASSQAATYPGIDGRQYWVGSQSIDPTANIHPTAIISNNIKIGAYTRIGPGVILEGGAKIGNHCDIRANANVRASVVIGDYVFIGERAHVGSSRTGGSDNPLWIKDYSYIGPGAVVHASKVDSEVYYGANTTSDYGCRVGDGAILMSGASLPHDTVVRDHITFAGNLGLFGAQAGISDAQRLDLLGFHYRKWLTDVMGPALEKKETYEPPLKTWAHVNTGRVNGKIEPSAILVGNVNIEGAGISVGSYLEGNITVKKGTWIATDVMIVAEDAVIGDHTHIYDKAIVVDGWPARTRATRSASPSRYATPIVVDNKPTGPGGPDETRPDAVRIGIFNWINHSAMLQGTSTGDFAIANIGTSAASGTIINREAMLLNSSATYADQELPPNAIAWGSPAVTRILDSTMREREFFFYGKDYPTWDRQATPEEQKEYSLPRERSVLNETN